MNTEQKGGEFRARTRKEHEKAWRSPWLAWTVGFPSWSLQRFVEWYSTTPIARALRIAQPLGIAVSVAALLSTIAALWITIYEIREDRVDRKEARSLRRATLLAVLYERLEEARSKDEGKDAHQKHARAGQIPIFEELVRLGASLGYLDASNVNLAARDPGFVKLGFFGIRLEGSMLNFADFRNSNLGGAQFMRARLVHARFDGSYLIKADFSDADLRTASFADADLKNANFTEAKIGLSSLKNANLSGAIMKSVVGISQAQLDTACSSDNIPPQDLPRDTWSEKQLIWKENECKSPQDEPAE